MNNSQVDLDRIYNCTWHQNKQCLKGLFNSNPTESDCSECDQYIGPSRGLGDRVHQVTTTVGLDKAARVFKKKTGKDCGCRKRRALLNKKFPAKEND